MIDDMIEEKNKNECVLFSGRYKPWFSQLAVTRMSFINNEFLRKVTPEERAAKVFVHVLTSSVKGWKPLGEQLLQFVNDKRHLEYDLFVKEIKEKQIMKNIDQYPSDENELNQRLLGDMTKPLDLGDHHVIENILMMLNDDEMQAFVEKYEKDYKGILRTDGFFYKEFGFQEALARQHKKLLAEEFNWSMQWHHGSIVLCVLSVLFAGLATSASFEGAREWVNEWTDNWINWDDVADPIFQGFAFTALALSTIIAALFWPACDQAVEAEKSGRRLRA